jgi:hypothetical protein
MWKSVEAMPISSRPSRRTMSLEKPTGTVGMGAGEGADAVADAGADADADAGAVAAADAAADAGDVASVGGESARLEETQVSAEAATAREVVRKRK